MDALITTNEFERRRRCARAKAASPRKYSNKPCVSIMAKIIKFRNKAPDVYKKCISTKGLFGFSIFRVPDIFPTSE